MKLSKFITQLLSLMVLHGCQDRQMRDLTELIETPARAIIRVEANSKPKNLSLNDIAFNFNDDSLSTIDPFNMANINLHSTPQLSNTPNHHPKQALELYSLDALNFIGTIHKQQQIWAVISVSSNADIAKAIHKVTIGHYLGKNLGKITAILPNERKIILSESILNPDGLWVKRQSFLSMPSI